MPKEMRGELAIASVPMQTWGEIYDPDTALKKGTIFQELDKPFYLANDLIDGQPAGCGCMDNGPEPKSREEMMRCIYKVSFLLDDLVLYLDNHPEDKEALKLFHEKGKVRKQLLMNFAQQFYPLTRDCLPDCDNAAEEFLWDNGPLPWEGACV